MSTPAPALRQPKIVNKNLQSTPAELQYVIITLKDAQKLVISLDAYNGIIMGKDIYNCVFCRTQMELNIKLKGSHILLKSHKKAMESYPHLEEFGKNLLRKISDKEYYCTICNVIVNPQFIKRHIYTDAHTLELDKAINRSSSYKASF